jgi:hypothetical protein
MPQLKDVWANKDSYTKSASDLTRTLSLSGLAVVWIFRSPSANGSAIPPWLMWCSLLIVISLALDLAQYLLGAYRVDRFGRAMEQMGKKDTDIVEYPLDHPKPINRLWAAKIVFVGVAWLGLIAYITYRALTETLPQIGKG